VWDHPIAVVAFLAAAAILAAGGAVPLIRWLRQPRRGRAMQAIAKELGLEYVKRGDAYPRFELFRRHIYTEGVGTEARNILAGEYEGHDILVFDYAVRAQSGTVCLTHFLLALDGVLPTLLIESRPVLRRLGVLESAGIELDSVEFSRAFRIRAQDKRLAYEVCHPRLMACLLPCPEVTMAIGGDHLHLVFPEALAVRKIPEGLRLLVEIRKLMPAYLLEDWQEVLGRGSVEALPPRGWFEECP
jgi:hypothetical protein